MLLYMEMNRLPFQDPRSNLFMTGLLKLGSLPVVVSRDLYRIVRFMLFGRLLEPPSEVMVLSRNSKEAY